MNSDLLTDGLISYIVFLFSTTCHEAAHALVAKWGGDTTAFEGGQVSLNPLPHIRREPFGMVVLPLLSLFLNGSMIGWASAPYDPVWQRRYPRRAAWMSLAGPAANFLLVIASGVLLKVGMLAGAFTPADGISRFRLVSGSAGVMDAAGVLLSVFFTLNLLLGVFNLIPIPPFDGYGVLGLFGNEAFALRLEQLRAQIRQFSFVALLLGWQILNAIYPPVLLSALRLLYGV